jgi:hypothetical protein
VTRAHRAGRGEAGRLTIGSYTSLTAGNLRETLSIPEPVIQLSRIIMFGRKSRGIFSHNHVRLLQP